MTNESDKITMNKKLKNKNILFTTISFQNNMPKKIDKILKPDTDYELNWLPYKNALLHDKRGFWEYYCSLIRMKQLFFFAFCSFNDYNSGIIKKFIFYFYHLPCIILLMLCSLMIQLFIKYMKTKESLILVIYYLK